MARLFFCRGVFLQWRANGYWGVDSEVARLGKAAATRDKLNG
jgi:hypothetical protein